LGITPVAGEGVGDAPGDAVVSGEADAGGALAVGPQAVMSTPNRIVVA
jgi:hypothetical protein